MSTARKARVVTLTHRDGTVETVKGVTKSAYQGSYVVLTVLSGATIAYGTVVKVQEEP